MTTVDTFVGSQGSFMSSSHLIAGEEEAILVDALFTKSDAQQMVDRVIASGKRLTTVYITHAHPDHFLGLSVVLDSFPEAKAVATPAVAEGMKPWPPRHMPPTHRCTETTWLRTTRWRTPFRSWSSSSRGRGSG
jgi:glyoxylase-like metal-dependent hydrolase (beta-lactamase superfamily II)